MVGSKRKGLSSGRTSIEKNPTRQTPPRRLKKTGRLLYEPGTEIRKSSRNIERNITNPNEINIEAAKRVNPEVRKGQDVWNELRERGWKALTDSNILGDFVFVAPGQRSKAGAVEGVTKYTGYTALSAVYHDDGNNIDGIERRAKEALALEKGGMDIALEGVDVQEAPKLAIDEASNREATQTRIYDMVEVSPGVVTGAVSMSHNDDGREVKDVGVHDSIEISSGMESGASSMSPNDGENRTSKEEKEFLRLKGRLDRAKEINDEFSVRFYSAALNRFLSKMES
eukprot:CAMPEP_0172504204 /NCGR_PEP_ID=MMETSP1066-20121228/176377_1 /TAXON_ID=671091 /ORGANISM="Coscinodiscus wailesii, Strain CCMP2513" /LENGTH=283 /DNA_ID=CAMNT_0013280269 /DNA_START=25 /DNA_END=876 /DNA_ORIENTATION=+